MSYCKLYSSTIKAIERVCYTEIGQTQRGSTGTMSIVQSAMHYTLSTQPGWHRLAHAGKCTGGHCLEVTIHSVPRYMSGKSPTVKKAG